MPTKNKSVPPQQLENLITNLEFRTAVQRAAEAGVRLNTTEAAAYLGKSPGTLNIWRSQKRGPIFELSGTQPCYTKQALDAWRASCVTKRRVSPDVGRPPGRGKSRRRAVRS